MKIICLCFLFLFNTPDIFKPPPSNDYEQSGKVVKIVDGDTFDLLTKEKNILRVRMNGIDCPERKQDYYQSAKNALAGYVFNKDVKLLVTGRDRNKRLIATVYCIEKNINLAMIENGYAWHYKKYSADTSYARAENEARLARKGLWQIDHPVAPWDFRKKKAPAVLN